MAESRNRSFAKLAKDIDTSGNIVATGISSSVSLGATVYASRANLPSSGNTAGDQAYVTDNNRLYIWTGAGWYNVALLNVAPSIQSVLDSDGGTTPFSLSTEGAVTTITITAADSDGDPITYSAAADSDFGGLATISQVDNVFTITPFSQDSATTESGTITFTATDGVNVASSGVQTFTLYFVSPYWDETVLSIGTSSTNSLTNSNFIDRSTNAFTFTKAGTPIQTAFHPYLDNWSYFGDGTNNYLVVDNTSGDLSLGSGDFTIESWIYFTSMPAGNSYPGSAWLTGGGLVSSSIGFDIAFGSTNLQVGLSSFNSLDINVAHNLTTNTWYHFALVRNGSTLTAYINGTSLSSVSVSGSANPCSGGLAISAAEPTGATDGNFPGYISNLRIVKGNALYTTTFTPSSESLTNITNTVLLTCQSNRFIDNSSNPKDITSFGSSAVSAFNPFGQGSEYAVGENKGSVRMIQTNTEYLVTPQTASLSSTLLANNFTTEAWIYLEEYANGGASHIWNNSEAHSDGQTAFYIYADGRIMFGKVGINEVGSTSGTIKLNTWHHVAMVRNGATTRIYVDGVDVANGASSTYLNSSNVKHMKIGRSSQTSGDYSFPGYISDFKVTPSAVYTSAFTPPTSPVGNTNASLYLSMDNAGIFDKTGNNTLTLNGDVSTSTTQTKFATTSMYFDGTGDYVSIEDSLDNFGAGDFTVEFWMNASALTGDILGKRNTETNYSPLLVFFNSNNFLVYGSSSGSGWEINSLQAPSINLSEWYHVALCRNNGSFKAFLNGVSFGTASVPNPLLQNADPFYIGKGVTNITASGHFNGYIENFQIIEGVAKYTTNFTPPTQTQGRQYQAES